MLGHLLGDTNHNLRSLLSTSKCLARYRVRHGHPGTDDLEGGGRHRAPCNGSHLFSDVVAFSWENDDQHDDHGVVGLIFTVPEVTNIPSTLGSLKSTMLTSFQSVGNCGSWFHQRFPVLCMAHLASTRCCPPTIPFF